MKRQKVSFYLMLLLFTIAIAFGVIYNRNNKNIHNKIRSNQQISVDNTSQKIEVNEAVQKVRIDGSNRIVITGTVDELSLDTNTGKYTLSMLLKSSGLDQQKILVELGSPKYQHLVRYRTPKGENNTMEEVRSMDSIAPALMQGKTVQIEVSMNPDIEDFWHTYRDTNRNEVFKVILPSIISIKI